MPDQYGTSPDASFQNKVVTFVNEAGADFHLSPADVSAQDLGIDLSADSTFAFNEDVDRETRVAPWDIGADQIVSTAIIHRLGALGVGP